MSSKDTNPKDAVGVRKWRQFTVIPFTALWEIGVAMLEGARKYGRHNYRVSGVRASVYIDAALGHITQWWEGEDIDPDSGMSHLSKAMASLAVLRDAMLNNNWTDDRPPKSNLNQIREGLQNCVNEIMDRYAEAKEPFTAVSITSTTGPDTVPAKEITLYEFQKYLIEGGGSPGTWPRHVYEFARRMKPLDNQLLWLYLLPTGDWVPTACLTEAVETTSLPSPLPHKLRPNVRWSVEDENKNDIS